MRKGFTPSIRIPVASFREAVEVVYDASEEIHRDGTRSAYWVERRGHKRTRSPRSHRASWRSVHRRRSNNRCRRFAIASSGFPERFGSGDRWEDRFPVRTKSRDRACRRRAGLAKVPNTSRGRRARAARRKRRHCPGQRSAWSVSACEDFPTPCGGNLTRSRTLYLECIVHRVRVVARCGWLDWRAGRLAGSDIRPPATTLVGTYEAEWLRSPQAGGGGGPASNLI